MPFGRDDLNFDWVDERDLMPCISKRRGMNSGGPADVENP
jgi:hypothetical protein